MNYLFGSTQKKTTKDERHLDIDQKMLSYKVKVTTDKRRQSAQVLGDFESDLFANKQKREQHRRQNSAMSSVDIKATLAEEWIRFFKERLKDISKSELEHNNVEIINFSWP